MQISKQFWENIEILWGDVGKIFEGLENLNLEEEMKNYERNFIEGSEKLYKNIETV